MTSINHRRRRRTPLSKRARRFLSTRTGRWTALSVLGLAVLAIGLLAQGYLNSPAPSVDAAPAPTSVEQAQDLESLPATPSASASATDSTSTSNRPATRNEVIASLKKRFGDNPLNRLRGDGIHSVTVSISSSSKVASVGYLVPTGLTAPYGTPKINSRSWTLAQQAVGPGYLAAVFVQAGREGAPITCSVTVDGKVTDTQTTSGQYGRTVCLG